MVFGGHFSFLSFCIKECDVNKWAKLCVSSYGAGNLRNGILVSVQFSIGLHWLTT